MDMVPTAACADYYARLVAEKAVLRDLISASGTIMQHAYDHAAPVEEILDLAESSIFQVSSARQRHSFHGMNTLVSETFQYINEMHENPTPVSGLATGFKDLDQLTSGLHPSSLNVLAARPSMGKTAAALSIGQHVALRENKAVAVFSLEMPAVQLVMRMLCSEARVDMSRIRNGQLSDRDFQRIADTAGRMSEARLFIDDNGALSVTELRSRARRLKAEQDIGLVIIDYLQLMSGGNTENRQQEISNISRGLKSLARELDIPVLVLSQLSRAVESRPNKRPMLSDLRECVTGDTLVNLADGTRRPISELVGSQPDVMAMDERGRIITANSDMVWAVGEREVFAVRLASGRTRRTTAQHLWYSFDGWKPLQQLRPGERVAIARRLPESTPSAAMPDEAAAQLGQLIGAGSEPAAAGAWLKELGIANQCSAGKRLPEVVFRLKRASQAIILRQLWAVGGGTHVRHNGQSGPDRVFFTAAGKLLAEDVAALLLRFGIVATIRPPARTGSWTVEVTGARQQKQFLDQ